MPVSDAFQELPHVSVQDEKIYMDQERVVLMSSSVFGTLRKDLMENIGMERMKGFLLRFGWNLGVNDASKALQKGLNSVQELLKLGPVMHKLKGHATAKTSKLDLRIEDGQKVTYVSVEGTWTNSYEAEEHIRQFGHSGAPVCHTLIGYASGYYSKICGHTVIFKEISCKGKGDPECRYVGKSLESWNGSMDRELAYYENKPIIKELELTYEKLLEERNNLAVTTNIHTKLTEELIKGSDLQSISNIVFQTTNIPLVIHDAAFRCTAFAGLSEEQLSAYEEDFKSYLSANKHSAIVKHLKQNTAFPLTKSLETKIHKRLITPILLRSSIAGYCSFIYSQPTLHYPEIDLMILERTANVCSLYLLNEKTSFEAFERMKGLFLEQILSGHFRRKQDILQRGSYIQLDLEQPYYIAVLKYTHPQERNSHELLFHEQVMETIRSYFKHRLKHVLIGQKDGHIIMLLQAQAFGSEQMGEAARRFIQHLSAIHPQCLFQAGISRRADEIERAAAYHTEAMTALRLTTRRQPVVLFETLGVIGHLLHPSNETEIKKAAHRFVGPLIESDRTKNTELVKTLFLFLTNGGNLEQTAAELSISMSGLRYRIQKIEQMLGLELRHPVTGYQLFLTLQALMVTGEIDFENN